MNINFTSNKSRLIGAAILIIVLAVGYFCYQLLNKITVPPMPTGLGFEQIVPEPNVTEPLPAISFIDRNDKNGRFYLESNPINYALRGINDVWKGTTDQWQKTAGDYTDDINGYKAGDGPNPHNAANDKPSDYVTEGTEIVDSKTWKANIQYVVNTTTHRTDEQALYAFLDDIRSKNYSTIDGFGPLTEDYAQNSGAYAKFPTIYVSDVLNNRLYKPSNNDDYKTYGGQPDSALGDMVKLARLFRASYASTSGPKYLFGTPRPWRMADNGTIQFQGVETMECVDGSDEKRPSKEVRIDEYISNVKIIPGLYCGRRAHSSSKEKELLYTADTENRRKDNGYPSGHTNAAILSSFAYAYALPERFSAHIARGVELGNNRIVAGMHSPVDVVGGRIQATMIAAYALNSYPSEANAAYQQARSYFGTKAKSNNMSLYNYANQEVKNEGSFTNKDGTLNINVFNNNRFNNHDEIKRVYTERLTSGLPQVGDSTLPPIVPKGAEALLKTRLPYLSAEQRRAVLATTELESGYLILDKSNGWGRLNLMAAADGYGAFDGDVQVTMNPSDDSYSSHDWWRNNIKGKGMLTKDGQGHLTLTGQNSYSGGTLLKAGVLEATSSTAFGYGDVFMTNGELLISSSDTLQVAGNYSQTAGKLTVELDKNDTQISVKGIAYLENAVLSLDTSNMPVNKDSRYVILTAENGLAGKFKDVLFAGHKVEMEYSSNTATVHIIE